MPPGLREFTPLLFAIECHGHTYFGLRRVKVGAEKWTDIGVDHQTQKPQND